jgi:hypothetical protein
MVKTMSPNALKIGESHVLEDKEHIVTIKDRSGLVEFTLWDFFLEYVEYMKNTNFEIPNPWGNFRLIFACFTYTSNLPT